MTESNFRKKISALMLATVITASALTAALPASQEFVPEENSTSVSENNDEHKD
ncbi:MAG: hypothetical protein IJU51_03015 [Clostridia bacterium]|nr:hypothetical protein [Clostridia bacterium]